MSLGNLHVTQVGVGTNPYVLGLVNAGFRWDTSSQTGDSSDIRFTFNGSGFSASQQTSVRGALAQWAAVADIDFIESFSATPRDDAELLFQLTLSANIGNFGGYSGTPNQALSDNTTVTENGDVILLGDRGRTYTYIAPNGTLYGRNVLDAGGNFTNAGLSLTMHEIGHALGLKHPHDDGSSNFSHMLPGVTENNPADLGDNSLNENLKTIMSYNDTSIGDDVATPMALDIAAIQTLYGARTSASPGNDTYTILDPENTTTWRSIWDTGGIDTIRYNGTANAVIDLSPATLRNEVSGGGLPSYSKRGNMIGSGYTIAGDVTNAIPNQNGVTGVIIENAFGGAGHDTIYSNNANNELRGNGGVDTIYGFEGDDSISGGQGADFLKGGGGADSLYGGTEADKLNGDEGDDLLSGEADDDQLHGGHGNDVFIGGTGADFIDGDGGIDQASYLDSNVAVSVTLGPNGGNGTATGGTATGDRLYEIENLVGSSFDDFLQGNGGNNELKGGGGDDTLKGLQGADRLIGDSGIDTASYFGATAAVTVNLVTGLARLIHRALSAVVFRLMASGIARLF